jgi:predicted MFS family arabinose efflux permease
LIGRYVFIVVAIAAFGQLIVGYLVDHFSIRVVFVFVAALQAIFLAVMPGLTGWNALFVATAFMFVVFGQIPINDVLISRITQSQWRSRVYAFRYIVTFSVMASSLPIIALIHARWGFDSFCVRQQPISGGILPSLKRMFNFFGDTDRGLPGIIGIPDGPADD